MGCYGKWYGSQKQTLGLIMENRNKDAQQQAVIKFQIDLYQRDDVGRCVPPLTRITNKNLTIVGENLEDINKKLELVNEAFKNVEEEISKQEQG